MGRPIVRPAAKRDLIRHFAYIGQNSSLAVARRFLAAARLTFDDLAQTPGMGAARRVGRFSNLRMWRIRDFEKYMIFYEASGQGVEILRIIHAAQDYNRILNKP